MAKTINEVLSYLEDTKQFDIAQSVGIRLKNKDLPIEFIEQVLSTSFVYGPYLPSVEEQINSPDFSYWKSLAVYLVGQGFWPTSVVQSL